MAEQAQEMVKEATPEKKQHLWLNPLLMKIELKKMKKS